MREDMRPFARACQLLRNKAPAVKQCKRLLRVQCSFHIRKFPEPGKQTRLGPLAHGVLPAALKKEDRLFFDAAGLFCLLDGERSPRAALFCKADCPQRTGIALRRAVWDAYTGSQFHQCLRQLAPLSGICSVNRAERRLIRLFDGRPRDRSRILRHAGEYAQHIPVNRRLRHVKADGRDRASRIIAHTWKRPDLGVFPRKRAAMLHHDHAGSLLQIAHAGIIAQPLPQFCETVLLTGRKSSDIGQLR